MCLSCGVVVCGCVISCFHLFTHAGFKALLFLTGGAIFHSVIHEQKIYKLGGLNKVLVLLSVLLLLSLMSLIGLPFSAGFYSKDFILRCSCFNSFV